MLRYSESPAGIYLAGIGFFDASIRTQYLLASKTRHIRLGDLISPRELTDTLIAFGFKHSPSLSHSQSYSISGSEFQIRDGAGEIRISYFGEEIDDLLIKDDLHHKLIRTTEIRLYNTESEIIPETLAKLRKESISGMLWSFDLDFIAERQNIRELFIDWVSFEWGGTSLEFNPLSIESLDELTALIKEHSDKVTFYTALTSVVVKYLEDNGLEASVITLPKVTGELSTQSNEHILIADDLLANIFVQKKSRRTTLKALDLLMSLNPWDYIVHENHGIGVFKTITKKEIAGTQKEFIELEYAKSDKLFVPITELHRITKYLGESEPILHTLGGAVWKKTMSDTEDEILQTAMELLDLYARRKLSKGYSFESHPVESLHFQNAFKYTHTQDQIRAIEDIFCDMESTEPMDRLLAGDVGFGKTEVAMNAAHKAVLSGKQVAIISPLVVLTLEHIDSFSERFRTTGMRIVGLSRLTPAREERAILAGLAAGTIDIVIGTHRLLGEDVEFGNLGLLVIDEEHRFGVRDKERIKELRQEIDILSLSATPIPRSLNMALSWMRKLSILREPPPSRKSIHTQILGWNPEVIKQVIHEELSRDGQVLFLHNRVQSLDGTAAELIRLIGPMLRPILLHGQMSTAEIENALLSFRAGVGNCLVTTTVIENGVNFLKANTIIIDHADEFWLAQLHQLRGRVGRWSAIAHALLLYRKPILADDAKKRLLTIAEHTELGAGFEIALRDLEIRGAWEILGISQSGKTKQTGMSLYFKLLEDKVEELKTGKKIPSFLDITLDLDISIVLDDALFTSDTDKLNFYRNLESVESLQELDEFSGAWSSESSEALGRLFLLLRARILLSKYRVISIKRVLWDFVLNFSGATTAIIREFLEHDRDGNFLVQNLERIKTSQKNYSNDLDFLEKLVYSLEYGS
jgi:transcription-repair coupling factor